MRLLLSIAIENERVPVGVLALTLALLGDNVLGDKCLRILRPSCAMVSQLLELASSGYVPELLPPLVENGTVCSLSCQADGCVGRWHRANAAMHLLAHGRHGLLTLGVHYAHLEVLGKLIVDLQRYSILTHFDLISRL